MADRAMQSMLPAIRASVAWAVFFVLFVANTALNLRGHFGDGSSG
jgi:hypothetical protein